MFNTLYFLDHNNYYDRIISIDWALGLYLESLIQVVEGFNFNPNDGVNTEIIVNMPDSETPNYLIVCDENGNIQSKWFIIDSNRIRGGQYKYTLHRDVISDYWNVIKQSPCLIEKCNLAADDPLIFNNEDMTFNQIKTNETLLKDKSDCAWLIAYIAKDATAEQLQGTINTNSTLDIDVMAYNEWSEFDGYQNVPFAGPANTTKYKINYSSYTIGPGYYLIDSNRNVTRNLAGDVQNSSLRVNLNLSENDREAALKTGFDSIRLKSMNSFVSAWAPDLHTQEELNRFLSLDGKYIKDNNGKIYLASVVKENKDKNISYAVTAGGLYNELTAGVSESKTSKGSNALEGSPNANSFSLELTYSNYKLTLIEMNQYETSYNMAEQTNRLTTIDSEYNIIAVPYGEVVVKNLAGNQIVKTNADLGMSFITSLQRGETPLVVYDIQLVPYCPIQSNITEQGEITVTSTAQYSLIKHGSGNTATTEGIIFFVPKSTFSSYIFEGFISKARSNIQRKINNECDKWRLTSPNYANYFDFSAEKNNGVFAYKVDCTYKPYSPYIHICPLFNGLLYGEDFNDPRGLVCGGDFSLTQVSDAWQTYQLQNKNYQQTFDRQIQNMEVNNKYQRITDITTAVAGTVQGATAGAMMGGGWGAAIGGVVSGVAGAADVGINEALRNEALDYSKDLFGYNLGNIQAIPLTLTKVSAFNANNKIFPVLEYYTCTDREKQALANKLAYNGMTTMVIDTIENNLGNDWEYTINNKIITSKNYIKAKPIRLDLYDDFHVANTIAKELDMGFYIDQEE